MLIVPRRRVATGGGTLWTPALTSTAGWYKYNDAATLTLSGNNITAASDKSGNNRNTTGTGTTMPQLSQWSGKNVAQFSGFNWFAGPTINNYFPSTSFACIFVARATFSTNSSVFYAADWYWGDHLGWTGASYRNATAWMICNDIPPSLSHEIGRAHV